MQIYYILKPMLWFSLLVFLSPLNAGFVIDHNSTNLSQIPDVWIQKAKKEIHGAYNHTSHGSQLITGMNTLRGYVPFGSKYDWSDTSSGDENSLSLDDRGISGEADLSQGDKDSDGDGIADWAEDTHTYLTNSSNLHVNLIMWSWCNIDNHNIPRYLNSMEWLIAQFSEGGTHTRASTNPVDFVFMTAHANGGGEGDSADIRNEQIRLHVAQHNRILFDFSDIENYDPDQNYYLDKLLEDGLHYDSNDDGSRDANWATEYLTRHSTSPLNILTTITGSCAHSPEGGETNDAKLNCVLKGRAVWHLFARLAGWDGSSRWAKRAGSDASSDCNTNSGESGNDIVVDEYGNSYVVGTFRETADIFGTTFTASTPNPVTNFDTFLTKFNKDGDAIWSKHAQGATSIQNPSIALDSDGNIFVTGDFTNSVSIFGAVISSTGSIDGYLVKLNNDGELLWSKTFGGRYTETPTSIHIDKTNHIYITGFFSSATADSNLFGTNLRSNGWANDGFVAKLDSDGNGIWTKAISSDSEDRILDVAVDSDSNVFVSGLFSNTATIFDTNLTSVGQYDAFVAKLDSNGSRIWVKQAGASSRDEVNSLVVGDDNAIYVAGSFRGNADIFGQTVNGDVSRDDVFVVKMANSDGSLDWLKHLSSSSYIYSADLAISGNTLHTIGSFSTGVTIDTTSISTYNGYDIYVASFETEDGNVTSLNAEGGVEWDYGEAIAVNDGGTVFITGRFQENIDLYGTDLSSAGCYDIFVAQNFKGTPATQPQTTMKINPSIFIYLLD